MQSSLNPELGSFARPPARESKRSPHAPGPLSQAEKNVQGILASADIQVNGRRPWDVQVLDKRLYARLIKEGSLGAGEAYAVDFRRLPVEKVNSGLA